MYYIYIVRSYLNSMSYNFHKIYHLIVKDGQVSYDAKIQNILP